MLKDYLQEAPILRYPDPSADYILYTDASKYVYAGILIQTRWYRPPSGLHLWVIHRITIKLGSPYKRSICYIYVS